MIVGNSHSMCMYESFITVVITPSLISDQGISPQVFITLDDKDINEIGFSFGGKKLLKSLVKELNHSQERASPDEGDPIQLGEEYSKIYYYDYYDSCYILFQNIV